MDPEGTTTAVPFLDATNHADRCSSGTADCSDLKKMPSNRPWLKPALGSIWLLTSFSAIIYTLPETNIAPENRPFQNESSIPTIHFQGLC